MASLVLDILNKQKQSAYPIGPSRFGNVQGGADAGARANTTAGQILYPQGIPTAPQRANDANGLIKGITTSAGAGADVGSGGNPGGPGGAPLPGDNGAGAAFAAQIALARQAAEEGRRRAQAAFAAQIALARQAAEEGRRRAQAAFDRARGVYDEGIGLLNQRRGEFQDIYDTGNQNILNSYEQQRGNLQAESQGANERMRNSLRALGLGGSAFVRASGRQRQQEAKAAGQLSTERAANEQENLSGYNKNVDFANTQESALNRYLQDAQEAQRASDAQTSLVQQGDINSINQNVNSFLSQLASQNAALDASRGAIGNYQTTPFGVNISDFLGSINSGLPDYNQGNQQAQNVNLNQENLSYLDRLRSRAGGSLYA